MNLFKLSSLIICLMLFSCIHENKPVPIPTPIPIPIPAPLPLPAPAPPEKVVIYFNFDSSKLSKDQKEAIKKTIENKAKDIPVHIVGYTDSQGSAKYNLKLSTKRAKAVEKYLLKLHMLGPISYEGKGEVDLVNVDKTIADHKLNRRTEVVFVLTPMETKKEVDTKKIKKVKKFKWAKIKNKKTVKKTEAKAEKKTEPNVKDLNVKMMPAPEQK